jgi:hypothetical protein
MLYSVDVVERLSEQAGRLSVSTVFVQKEIRTAETGWGIYEHARCDDIKQ